MSGGISKNEYKNSLKAVENECVSSNKTTKIVPAISQTAVESVVAPKCDGIVDNKQNVCHGGNSASKI